VTLIPGLEIEEIGIDRLVVLSIVGRIPLDRLSDLNQLAFELITAGRRGFVADMSRTEEVSSNALATLAYYSRHLREKGGALALVRPPDHVARILRLTCLEDMLQVFDTRDEALAWVRRELSAAPRPHRQAANESAPN